VSIKTAQIHKLTTGVEDVCLESGLGIEKFEGVAALAGLETVLGIDYTRRTIRLHTDSQFALLFCVTAPERTILPSRRSFDLDGVSSERPEFADRENHAVRRARRKCRRHSRVLW
jgi:hypothetical protein